MRVCGMASRGTRLERGRDRGELSQALEPRSLLTPPEGPTGKGMEGSWLQKCFIDQPTFLSRAGPPVGSGCVGETPVESGQIWGRCPRKGQFLTSSVALAGIGQPVPGCPHPAQEAVLSLGCREVDRVRLGCSSIGLGASPTPARGPGKPSLVAAGLCWALGRAVEEVACVEPPLELLP